MVHDLKTKLLSGVIISTKPKRISYGISSRNHWKLGSTMALVAAAIASSGLVMLLIRILKILF